MWEREGEREGGEGVRLDRGGRRSHFLKVHFMQEIL